MQTVQTLIDQYGPPPAEVCLDWAWQLDARLGQALHEESDLGLQRAELVQPHEHAWREIGVGEDGQLQLDGATEGDHGFLPEASVRAFRAQLMTWVEASIDPGNRASGNELSLASATTQVLASSDQPESRSGLLQPKRSSMSASVSRPRSSRHANARRLSLKWIAAAVMSLVIGGLAFAPYRWLDSEPAATAIRDTRIESGGSPNAVSAAAGARQEGAEESAIADVGRVASPDAGELDQVDADGAALQTLAALDPTERDASLAGFPTGPSAEAEEGSDELSAMAASADVDRNSAEQEAAGETQAPSQEPQFDVLAALKSLTETFSSRQQEGDLQSQDDDAPSAEPLIVTTSPAFQVLRLPTGMRVRARTPTWHLRVVASEGFVVVPTAAQQLAERSFVQWTVRPDEKQDRETACAVLVRAQMAGSRNERLQWQVVGVADALPQLAMPLSTEYLRQTRMMLAQTQNQLNAAQSIVSRGRGSSEYRRYLKQQGEFVEQVLDIVNRLQEVERALDGQFEVHARLVDEGASDAIPLIEFGTLDQPEDDDATTEQTEGL